MQFLLFDDYVIHAVQNQDTQVLERCNRRDIEAWVMAPSVPLILERLSATGKADETRQALGRFLSAVTLLPVTGEELKSGLKAEAPAFSHALALEMAARYKLKGIVTTQPAAFPKSDVPVITPDQLDEIIARETQPDQPVPLLNILATYPQIMEGAEAAMLSVVRSGHYILGPQVEQLEQEMASYCGVQHAIGVSSGTDALLLALMTADIGEGDEVITTPFTFFATAGSIARTGAKPVFVDIEPDSFNLDPQRIAAAITPKTRAIMPVHLYGQCAGMDAINAIAEQHKLLVFEDAAQASGATCKGRQAGSMGDFGCLSFFPTKNLGGFGDGGMVTVRDPALYEKCKVLRVHGSAPKYYHKLIGGNFRIDALQAAVLRAKLPFLDTWLGFRRGNAQRYTNLFTEAGLANVIGLPPEVVAGHTFNQYVIRVKDGKRDALRAALAEKKVMTEIYYPVPLHLQECFRNLGHKQGDFPISEQAADEVLALPAANEVTATQQQRVVSVIRDFFK
ncbi:DegT/DnrJ/EryC1/StrS family aminotransferase [Nitrospina watsonii]|uniref:Glutamine--scyllo-inositol transaminase n=1 Tax=Nitrospina watsonii TaxID=1323948 RepID=A0ABM9HBM0_9BACT|nr:DegT/DnrJ/EryC1/StrS family aminotransferase [Nitrospina watsonii]CAI2717492.1 Glutamine--scyllo-inositol transaminase [Nitrospina watsonii]